MKRCGPLPDSPRPPLWLPPAGFAGMDMCFAFHRTILLGLSWTSTLACSAGSDPAEPHATHKLGWRGQTWSLPVRPRSSRNWTPRAGPRRMAGSRKSGRLYARRVEGRRARDTMMMLIIKQLPRAWPDIQWRNWRGKGGEPPGKLDVKTGPPSVDILIQGFTIISWPFSEFWLMGPLRWPVGPLQLRFAPLDSYL